MSEQQYAYFIDHSKYSDDPPECVKLPILKSTAKQIKVESCNATEYRSIIPKDKVNWTAKQAWAVFHGVQDLRLKAATNEVERLTKKLEAANQAIRALEAAEQESPA